MKQILTSIASFARTQGTQPSTWRGAVLLASACGVALKPDVGEAIIAVGLSISGLIGLLVSDPPAPPAP